MIFCPSKREIKKILFDYFRNLYRIKLQRPFESLWSFSTGSLALISLILIFTYSPVISTTLPLLSFELLNQNKPITKTFSFIPGSAPSKFDDIDLQNLDILAFYDLPFGNDGYLIQGTDGYSGIYSEKANNLFHKAHQQGSKVLATLTQTYKADIINFLDNPIAQENLFQEAKQIILNTGIDGIAINIENINEINAGYKNKYTQFINKLTQQLHNNITDSIVAVAIPDNIRNDTLYDISALSKTTDNTLIIAYSSPVPETNNLLSQSNNNIFTNASYKKKEDKFMNLAEKSKLIVERAWYGNELNYPLYTADNPSPNFQKFSFNTMNVPLSQPVIESLISDVPSQAQYAARKNLPYIIEALKNEKILNANVLAYALATIQHETAGTFEPLEEYNGRKNARRLGYDGGTNYFGRGFIQLTHLKNYQKFGKRIGVGDKLAKNPDMATHPDIAAKILAAYFKDFGIAQLATDGNFIDARSLVNPDYNGFTIAEIAYMYLNALYV